MSSKQSDILNTRFTNKEHKFMRRRKRNWNLNTITMDLVFQRYGVI